MKGKYILLFLFFNNLLVFAQDQPQENVAPSFFFESQEETLENARQLYEQEKYEESAKYYENFIQNDPTNRDALFHLGQIYYRLERWDEAAMIYQKILQLNPNDYDAMVGLAYVYYRSNKVEESEKLFKKVIKENPQYADAYLGLAMLYKKQQKTDLYKKMYTRAFELSPNRADILKIVADENKKSGNFHLAYTQYKKLQNISPSQENIDQLSELRPLIYPTLTEKLSYTVEEEVDLVSKIKSVRLKYLNQVLELKVPLSSKVTGYTSFHYSPIIQFNIVSDVNNYFINTYLQTTGLNILLPHSWSLKVDNNFRWGKNHGRTVFPFKNTFVWQPGVLLRYGGMSHNFWIGGYKDTFEARNFNQISSFFVRRKTALTGYQYRFFLPHSSVGSEFNVGYYKGVLSNRKIQATYWFRFGFPKEPMNMIVEYKGQWSSFKVVDPDYFSYKRRWEQYIKWVLSYIWEDDGALEISYTFSWQKIKDFTNIAEVITPNTPPPEILNKNVFRGHTLEAVGRVIFTPRFSLEGNLKYYKDSNNYKVLGGYGSFIWVF